jgi:hypothetical protein
VTGSVFVESGSDRFCVCTITVPFFMMPTCRRPEALAANDACPDTM